MILLTLVTATAVISSQLTAHLAGLRHATDAAGYFAAVWREGYIQGAEDEAHAEAIDFEHSGYGRVGPNRANPYPGPEKLAQHA
ncbi:hypothetical protein [Pseudarthrobacter sp. NIBRBAC000502770]|uniref:hypothetical protein n=1 Tax=Pseudarthrobacter sp. NIBRBAC000502770 TaxID=2590785 RepID=UPI001FEE5DAC|nr:hypothetical protein [Pseudarthrobacter sp. NIBRBAC000502770]